MHHSLKTDDYPDLAIVVKFEVVFFKSVITYKRYKKFFWIQWFGFESPLKQLIFTFFFWKFIAQNIHTYKAKWNGYTLF